ncbi:MAG: PfkB family carbohydrate kinase [Rhodobacteraceae bacterium]|nr:PfkB family carbohydrate kinase [Paracoccaceae bacterium]
MSVCDIAVVGATHWDIVGTSSETFTVGEDKPGIIRQNPGGVAFTVAAALTHFNIQASLISAVGEDKPGERLLRSVSAAGIAASSILTNPVCHTDQYLAIEDQTALVAAIADCRCLEESEPQLFARLRNWLNERNNRRVRIVLDGNLSGQFLNRVLTLRRQHGFVLANIAASPNKSSHIIQLAGQSDATIYLNAAEAAQICGYAGRLDSRAAAESLLRLGFGHVVVTDAYRAATEGSRSGLVSAAPLRPLAAGVTGAGDRFAAAHLAAGINGVPRKQALKLAHDFAANGNNE